MVHLSHSENGSDSGDSGDYASSITSAHTDSSSSLRSMHSLRRLNPFSRKKREKSEGVEKPRNRIEQQVHSPQPGLVRKERPGFLQWLRPKPLLPREKEQLSRTIDEEHYSQLREYSKPLLPLPPLIPRKHEAKLEPAPFPNVRILRNRVLDGHHRNNKLYTDRGHRYTHANEVDEPKDAAPARGTVASSSHWLLNQHPSKKPVGPSGPARQPDQTIVDTRSEPRKKRPLPAPIRIQPSSRYQEGPLSPPPSIPLPPLPNTSSSSQPQSIASPPPSATYSVFPSPTTFPKSPTNPHELLDSLRTRHTPRVLRQSTL